MRFFMFLKQRKCTVNMLRIFLEINCSHEKISDLLIIVHAFFYVYNSEDAIIR